LIDGIAWGRLECLGSECVDGVGHGPEACLMKDMNRGRKPRRGLDGREGTGSPKTSQSCFTFLLCLTLGACGVPGGDAAESTNGTATLEVHAGIEVLITDSIHLVRGKRVGLITNHTSIYWLGSGDVGSTIDALDGEPEIDLVALFAPEHGIRGEERAGAAIESGIDEQTGIQIHSLYGAIRQPTPEMLADIDVLLFDMQDIGARYYTYVSTMALAMRAAGENDVPFVVLDRPNPIRGDIVQGNVLDPEYSTFVGMFSVPMRHGMTAGELARMYVGEFGIETELHVVPVSGWQRSVAYEDTGLPWVAPSPNIPSQESALAYPGTCLFEGTPVSVGRGTERAFQWIGAPWLDGPALAATLNAYELEGVSFEAVTFTPTNAGDGKFEGQEVSGVRLVPSGTSYNAPEAAVAMLIEARAMSGDDWSWRVAHFDRLAGTDALRLGLDAGVAFEDLVASWDGQVASFASLRAPYLIYN
jgi:uncharacterized protein YbbC (DUF1343 family)